jgi:hypothetical protein
MSALGVGFGPFGRCLLISFIATAERTLLDVSNAGASRRGRHDASAHSDPGEFARSDFDGFALKARIGVAQVLSEEFPRCTTSTVDQALQPDPML